MQPARSLERARRRGGAPTPDRMTHSVTSGRERAPSSPGTRCNLRARWNVRGAGAERRNLHDFRLSTGWLSTPTAPIGQRSALPHAHRRRSSAATTRTDPRRIDRQRYSERESRRIDHHPPPGRLCGDGCTRCDARRRSASTRDPSEPVRGQEPAGGESPISRRATRIRNVGSGPHAGARHSGSNFRRPEDEVPSSPRKSPRCRRRGRGQRHSGHFSGPNRCRSAEDPPVRGGCMRRRCRTSGRFGDQARDHRGARTIGWPRTCHSPTHA